DRVGDARPARTLVRDEWFSRVVPRPGWSARDVPVLGRHRMVVDAVGDAVRAASAGVLAPGGPHGRVRAATQPGDVDPGRRGGRGPARRGRGVTGDMDRADGPGRRGTDAGGPGPRGPGPTDADSTADTAAAPRRRPHPRRAGLVPPPAVALERSAR